MKKIIGAACAALVLSAHGAAAQQYVHPIYSQNSIGAVQPYAPAPTYAQAPAPQPSYYAQPAPASNAIPLSSGPAPVSSYGNTGYGAALYANADNAPTYYAPAAAPVPAYEAAPAYPPIPDARASYAPPAPVMRSGYNWGGCYIGGYGGGAFAGNTSAAPLYSQGGAFPAGTPYNVTTQNNRYGMGDQGIGGGTLGCNFELHRTFGPLTGLVAGAEAEGGNFTVTGSSIDPNSGGVANDTSDKTKLGNWDAIVAGRVGAAFDRTFLYGKFGAVFTEAHSTMIDTCTTAPCGSGTIYADAHKSLVDPAIGAGVEYALDNAWSIKGEYMYLDTADSYLVCGAGGASAAGSNFCSQHNLDGVHTVKVGLNYHFNDLFDSRGGNPPRW